MENVVSEQGQRREIFWKEDVSSKGGLLPGNPRPTRTKVNQDQTGKGREKTRGREKRFRRGVGSENRLSRPGW